MTAVVGFEGLTPIGKGGFSTVYRARQAGFDRPVALKVLNIGAADEKERSVFEQECRAMGIVSQHPHIVTILSADYSTEGEPCIVMELFSGGSLSERIKGSGPVPAADVLDIGVKLASALQTAHDRGLLHQDLKPQNVFISDFGQPALGDFGISKFEGERTVPGGGGITLHYAPPERIENEAATGSSDVYSLAATLYTAVVGRRPFEIVGGPNGIEDLARRIVLEDPQPLGPAVPIEVERVLVRAMAKRPGDRPASALAFAEELRDAQRQLGLAPTDLVVDRRGEDPIASSSPSRRPPIDDEPSSRTVARAPSRRQEIVDIEAERGRQGPSRARRILAVVLAVLAIGAVVVAVRLTIGQGDPDDIAQPTVRVPTTTNLVIVAPATPEDLTVVGPENGEVTVSWSRSPNATAYELTQIDGEQRPPVLVDAPATSFVLGNVDETARPCFQIAARVAGRVSEDSPVVCAEGIDPTAPSFKVAPESCSGSCVMRIIPVNFSRDNTVNITLFTPSGTDFNAIAVGAYATSAATDETGRFEWSFEPGAAAERGEWRIIITDDLTGRNATEFFALTESDS